MVSFACHNVECIRKQHKNLSVELYYCREYLVDLVGKPGCLCEPDSLLNGPASISISSPLRFPRSKPVETNIDFRSLAKQYFSECQSLNLVFEDTSAGKLFTFLIIHGLIWNILHYYFLDSST